MYDSNPTLSQLEREAEQTRAELASTIGQLHERLTPQAMKAEVEDYVRSTGQDVYQKIEQRVRENPLQTVAIAAGLAFPLFRLLSAIPAPVLMVGAGLAMAKVNSANGAAAGNAVRDAAASALNTVQDQLADTTEKARRGMNDATDAIRQQTSAAQATVADLKGQATAAVSKAGETISQAVNDAGAAVRQSAASAASSASQAGQDALQSGHQSFVKAVEQHPLVVGGIGLAIGAILAAAFPATRAEGQVLGAASRDLQQRAQHIATDTVAYAQEQGLGTESLREGVKGLGDKLRNVATQAADAPSVAPQHSFND